MKRPVRRTIGFATITLACIAAPALAQAAPPAGHPLGYGHQEMFSFDVDTYLRSNAPALLPYAEAISHWAGYTSISPRVLIALIEQQSGLISRPQQGRAALLRPMGDLSSELGFVEQIRDVADQLARSIYAPSAAAGRSEFGASRASEAKAALPALLTRNRALAQARAEGSIDTGETEFANVYQRLFGNRFDVDGARRSMEDFQPGSSAKSLLRPSGDAAAPGKKAAAGAAPTVRVANAASSYLQYPFPVGQSWYVGGAHANDGAAAYPLSSLDMYKSGGWGSNQSGNWVVASASGTFKRHSSCFAEIVHTDGWSTTYYHMQNLRYNTGAYVYKNAGIGNPASTQAQALCNGGQSTGPHLHWSLKYNGSWIHLGGYGLSGWIVTANGTNYDTDCSRFYMSRGGYYRCAGYHYND